MIVPTDWLRVPESIEEVEERLATEGAPDLWLAEWRRFIDHFEPDDEFWSYSSSWDLADFAEGYARVRDDEVVESISTSCNWC